MRTTHALIATLTLAAVGCGGAEPASQAASELAQRQASVAEAGADVMPFDLDETTHVFEKTDSGGLQQVVADSSDPDQVRLIREHLTEEAERFARGDFHDPQMIHGEGMPGLHDLILGHEKISVQYSEIDRGAQIVYATDDPDLVGAIHAWFDAQLHDHGEHAQSHR